MIIGSVILKEAKLYRVSESLAKLCKIQKHETKTTF